ncbi:MAG: hypothetical protein H6Q75_1779 [Firmicutes bacterium]|nr:hypothetical protein [Bacillota bacterium]
MNRNNDLTQSGLLMKLAGLGFTLLIALIGQGLSKLPGMNQMGPLASSILIAVLYRQTFGYPERLRPGIEIAAKKLLRFAIVLFGLKLQMDVLFQKGLLLLAYDIITIFFALIVTLFLARLFKADMSLSLLLAIGTGVCGAAAIAAVSPIIRAKEEDTAIGIGSIALIGTIFAVGYTLLRPLVALSDLQYGIWSGISLHEIAHVALAAAPAGQDALAVALLAKLGRVFLLIPLSFALLLFAKKQNKNAAHPPIEFPWFLAGFILTSFLASFVLGKYLFLPTYYMTAISDFTTLLLTMAMVGLGLKVSLRDLRTKALKPLLALIITSVLLSLLTFYIVF